MGAAAGEPATAVPRLPSGQVAHLRGTLSTEKHYGPPGYGEDKKRDLLWSILVLNLDTPINLFDPKDPTVDGIVKRVQVTPWFYKGDSEDFDRAAEKSLHVEIEGRLDQEGIHQFLDASLSASALTVLQK